MQWIIVLPNCSFTTRQITLYSQTCLLSQTLNISVDHFLAIFAFVGFTKSSLSCYSAANNEQTKCNNKAYVVPVLTKHIVWIKEVKHRSCFPPTTSPPRAPLASSKLFKIERPRFGVLVWPWSSSTQRKNKG